MKIDDKTSHNSPSIRFPEFTGEWKNTTLEECVDFLDGQRKPIKSDDRKGEKRLYPYYGASGIIDYIDEYIFDGDYILLSEDGANIIDRNYRVAFIANGKIWVNNHAHVLQPHKEMNINFLSEALERINYAIYNTGTTMPKLNQEICRKINLNVPSLSEQNKIGNLLYLLNERIATQNRLIEDLKKFKCAIVENVLNNRHSRMIRLGDIGSYIRGLTYSSNDVVEQNGTFIMRSNNIVNGCSLDYYNDVVSVNKRISKEQMLQNGDIIICMANGCSALVGKSSFYDGKCPRSITVGAFCGIYRSEEPIVKWLFQTNRYRRYIWNSLQGGNGAIANLNGEDILRMSFPIPDAPVKNNCVKLLTSVDFMIENATSLCVLYTSQKEYLLRQMFI